MLFNTFTYLIFLCLAVISARRFDWRITVLGLSIIFYGFWDYRFIPLIFLVTTVDYFCAIFISKNRSPYLKKIYLSLAIGINLSALIFFKYLTWLVGDVFGLRSVMDEASWVFNIILPLGISFYTFEAISYVVDVYRGEKKAEKDYLNYLLFIFFFPKLIAGPILRAGYLIPQFSQPSDLTVEEAARGIRVILIGLFVKVVLADNIAPIVDEIFEVAPQVLGPLDISTMGFLFGWQIYFDFLGYSLIAIGSARLLGIDLPQNFDQPYFATDIREFWQKWHITLSDWIRDYLYIPLAKVMSGDARAGDLALPSIMALCISWSIMGFWHGAGFTFLFWGLSHAAFILIRRLYFKLVSSLPWSEVKSVVASKNLNPFYFAITLYCVMLAWVPFRASSTDDAISLFISLFDTERLFQLAFRENVYLVAFSITVVYFLWVTVIRWMTDRFSGISDLIILASIPFTVLFFQKQDQFIYFQF